MIRFRLAELIADSQFKTGRRITLLEIAEATSINRMTLSRMTNVRGYSTSTDTIEKLCKFFGCGVGDVAQYVTDEDVAATPVDKAPPARVRASRRRIPPK